MSAISNKILSLIKEKELSYGVLSSMTGIPKSALQRYATGETEKIPLDRLESIAKALGVSSAYLMGWESDIQSIEEPVLDNELIRMLINLTPEEEGKVFAFIQGLYANRQD